MGRLTFSGKEIDEFDLNIFDLTTHFTNIEKIEYHDFSQVHKDYFDIVISVIEFYSVDEAEEVIALKPILQKYIKEAFSNEVKKKKLIELGATETDFALINNDHKALKNIIDNFDLNQFNIYELHKFFRFMNYSFTIYNEAYPTSLMENIYDKINGIEVHDNSIENKGNKIVLINIVDYGEQSWDYTYTNYEFHKIKNLFDSIILYGTGGTYINNNSIINILNNPNIQNLNSNFLVVRIHTHDYEESGVLTEIINQFHDNLAKQTLYIIQACYSGKYHANWNKKAILITTSSAEQWCSYKSFDTEELNNICQNNKASLNNFIRFYAKYSHSTPYLSGEIEGKYYSNVKVFDYYISFAINEYCNSMQVNELKEETTNNSNKLEANKDTIETNLNIICINDSLNTDTSTFLGEIQEF